MNKLKGAGMLGCWDQAICRVQKWYLTRKQGVINWGQFVIDLTCLPLATKDSFHFHFPILFICNV